MSAAPRPSAATASVVFLKCEGLARSPVAEQARARARLEEIVSGAVAALPEDARVVLEAPDGAAVVVLADPEAALDVARVSVATMGDLALSAGLSHGPVRVAGDEQRTLVMGDAIATAETMAEVRSSGRVVASRDFRKALAAVSPARARGLGRAGTFSDALDRAHETYFADEGTAVSRRRQFLTGTAGWLLGVVVLGLLARIVLEGAGIIGAPATLRFEIRPAGEVFVDGVSKGRSPPLDRISVPAGRHTIEVKSGRYPPLVTVVDVKSGEELAIKHSFTAPRPQQQRERPFWRRFMDSFK